MPTVGVIKKTVIYIFNLLMTFYRLFKSYGNFLNKVRIICLHISIGAQILPLPHLKITSSACVDV